MNLVKASNASFSGYEFDLRWNINDSAKADQWAQVAFIEIDYFDGMDYKPPSPAPEQSLPENSGQEFSVNYGLIVDAIRNSQETLWSTSLCMGGTNVPQILQIPKKTYRTLIPIDNHQMASNSYSCLSKF